MVLVYGALVQKVRCSSPPFGRFAAYHASHSGIGRSTMGNDRSDEVRETLSPRRALQVGAGAASGIAVHMGRSRCSRCGKCPEQGGGKARAARLTQTAPNLAVEPTPRSVRSSVASASRRGSPPALPRYRGEDLRPWRCCRSGLRGGGSAIEKLLEFLSLQDFE